MKKAPWILAALLSFGLVPASKPVFSAPPNASRLSDSELRQFFSREDLKLTEVLHDRIDSPDSAGLHRAFAVLLRNEPPVAKTILAEEFGAAVALADVERAVEAARELLEKTERTLDTANAGQHIHQISETLDRDIAPGALFDGTRPAAQGYAPTHSPGFSFLPQESGASPKDKRPFPDNERDPRENARTYYSLRIMGGPTKIDGDSGRMGGFMFRVPFAPWVPRNNRNDRRRKEYDNKYGNLGLELGFAFYRRKAPDPKSLLNDLLENYSAHPPKLTVGDYRISHTIVQSQKSTNVSEFAGVSYQSPTLLRFLALEIGTRFAAFSKDSRVKTREAVTRSEFRGWHDECREAINNGISYDNGTGRSCTITFMGQERPGYIFEVEDWNRETLSENVQFSPGTRSGGIAGVSFIAANALLSKHFGLRYEASRLYGAPFKANTHRVALQFTF